LGSFVLYLIVLTTVWIATPEPPVLLLAVILSHGSVLPVHGLLILDAVDAALAVERGVVTSLPEPPVDAVASVQLVQRTVLATSRTESLLRQVQNPPAAYPMTNQMAAQATMPKISSSVNFISCHLP